VVPVYPGAAVDLGVGVVPGRHDLARRRLGVDVEFRGEVVLRRGGEEDDDLVF
jgi:hypothetical protein